MKSTFVRFSVTLLAAIILLCAFPASAFATYANDVVVLFTNDVHCGVEGYAKLAAYRAQLIASGKTVITVDAGDAIQGEMIGALTNGTAISEIMNAVGYDYAVPGNHEFDYNVSTLLHLAADVASYEYLSANFIDKRTNNTVFAPYALNDYNGIKIAVVGISTPETYTKSSPAYFQDDNGNNIYSFSEDNFYKVIQSSVDKAVSEGADFVVAVGHLGIEGTTEQWASNTTIENTTGIDIMIDAHSHEEFNGVVVKNKNGRDVLLASTGTKLKNIGEVTIKADGSLSTKLIETDSIAISGTEAQAAAEKVQFIVDDYNNKFAYLYEVLGTADTKLAFYHPETGEWIGRTRETNVGNFVADAYRKFTGADIGVVNSGGVRSEIEAGEVTRKMLMDINPWANEMCVISATGQQIVDALEYSVGGLPEPSGCFLQVSGLSFTVEAWRDSPVIKGEKGEYVGLNENMPRRIKDVKVEGKPIDLSASYTVAGSCYVILDGGDGFTMLEDCDVLQKEELPVDSAMLVEYFVDYCNGRITSEQYGNVLGEGRITIETEKAITPETNDGGEAVFIIVSLLTLAFGSAAFKSKRKTY